MWPRSFVLLSRLLAVLFPVASISVGCADERCGTLSPRAEVAYTLPDPAFADQVTHITVTVRPPVGDTRARQLDRAQAGVGSRGGRFVLVFDADPAAQPRPDDRLVVALEALDARERVLARGERAHTVAAGGCNFIEIALQPVADAKGGGADPDSPTCEVEPLSRPALATSVPGLLRGELRGVHLVAETRGGLARRRWFIGKGWSAWDQRVDSRSAEPQAIAHALTVAFTDARSLATELLLALHGSAGQASAALWVDRGERAALFSQIPVSGPFFPAAAHVEPHKLTVSEPAQLVVYGMTLADGRGSLVEVRWDGRLDEDKLPSAGVATRPLPASASRLAFAAHSSVFFTGNRLVDADLPGPASMLFAIAATAPDGADEVWLGLRDYEGCTAMCWQPLGRPDGGVLASRARPLAVSYWDELRGRQVARVFVEAVSENGATLVHERLFDGLEWTTWNALPAPPAGDVSDAVAMSTIVAWRRESLLRLQLFGRRSRSGKLVELRQGAREQWSWSEELQSLQGDRTVGSPVAAAQQGEHTHVVLVAEQPGRAQLFFAHVSTEDDVWKREDLELCH